MNKKNIRLKNIEHLLSQRIKNIYQEQLEHNLDNISFQLFDRTLIITLEGIVTSPEKLLKESNSYSLAKKVREAIDNVIHPQIKDVIEEVLDVKVIDFLSDTTIEHDFTGAIAIFEIKPNNSLDNSKL